MSDLHPITTTALLEDADKIIRNHEQVLLVRALVADLTARGVDRNQLMMACDIVDYFRRLGSTPTRPEDALKIFLGLEGERELDRVVDRWIDLGMN